MGLHQAIDNRLETYEFLNDTMLFVAGYMTWEVLVTRSNLDSTEEAEHLASVTYWQDLYDAAMNQESKDVVRLRMENTLNHAYQGADRKLLTEEQFLEVIGTTPVQQRINRRIPMRDTNDTL